MTDVYKGQEVADQWYGEVERYNFKKHSGPNTGTLPVISFVNFLHSFVYVAALQSTFANHFCGF